MIVFKTFFKVLKKYKFTVLLYTVLLIGFSGLNMKTNDTSTMFINTKPDILIINQDEDTGLTQNLIQYLKENCNFVTIKNTKNARKDALFYRDVNYIITIPKNYRNDILNQIDPIITIESTSDYQASLAEMILTRYLKTQKTFAKQTLNEEDLIHAINQALSNNTEIEVRSKVDTSKTAQIAFYFNFASYSMMAVIIFIIGFILSSFHDTNVYKRTIVSSMNYKKRNRQLLLASSIYALVAWASFSFLGILLLGNELLTIRGFLYLFNLFIFSFCCLTIALLVTTLIKNKNALNGIVNVFALGSSFLCGAFVPAEFLPPSVLTIAHLLPTYWFIHSNDLLKNIELFNSVTLRPIVTNFLILILFSIFFILCNQFFTHKKQKIHS